MDRNHTVRVRVTIADAKGTSIGYACFDATTGRYGLSFAADAYAQAQTFEDLTLAVTVLSALTLNRNDVTSAGIE